MTIAIMMGMLMLGAPGSVANADDANSSISLSISTDAVDNAFTSYNPPRFTVSLANKTNAAFTGFLRFNLLDLYTRKATVEYQPINVAAGGSASPVFAPHLQYSIYRVTAYATAQKDDNNPGEASASIVVANSPAKLARDLPDDWPLGAHHSNPSPILKGPMAGFKWYRFFNSWASMEPKRGEYNWKELDATLGDMRACGGKLLIALEGTPGWASSRAGPQDAKCSFAPDNFDDYRDFVHALVDHAQAWPELGAVEVWNEPNANLRWNDDLSKLVTMTQVTYEETRRTNGKIKVVGLTVSPGNHFDYVERLAADGIFNYMDICGGHFYEEIFSLSQYNLRNNLPMHVDMLRSAMRVDGKSLPIWDTESGMGWENQNGDPRPEGKMQTQAEIVDQLQARKDYNANEPWQMWGKVSEPRMAAYVVSGLITELGAGVEKHFTFHPNWYSFDHALNLPWVANGCLGEVLQQVDYHYIMPIGINAITGGPANVGAVAYCLGKPGGKQVIVAWAELAAAAHPHPGGWTQPLPEVAIQIPCAADDEVSVQDMYLRGMKPVKSQTYPGGDAVTVHVGEEPVYIWNWKYRDQ